MYQWLPRGLGFGAFCLYVWAAVPGAFWLDSGELSAAAFALGSAHPTGFPLFCIAGKIAQFIPFGEIGFRINLLSGLSAALAVFWTACIVQCLGNRDVSTIVGALAAGATLAVSLTFFRQATVAEVYAPNAAALAGTLLLFAKITKAPSWRYGGLIAIALGLGMALHITYLLVVPVIGIFFVVWICRAARWPLLVPALTVVVFAACYCYLPIRSSTGRTVTVDWGHPRTVARLADHISAGRPRRAFAASGQVRRSDAAMRSTNPQIVYHNAATFLGEAADQLGPATLLAALVGYVLLAYRRRTRWVGFALVGLATGDAVYSFWLNPMGMVDLQNGVPMALGICIAAGIGVSAFAQAVGRAAAFVGGTTALACLLPTALVSWGTVWWAATGDAPRAWSEAAASSVAPGGVALVQNDSTAAGMIFLNTVESVRPDIAVIVRQHLRGDWERTNKVLQRSDSRSHVHGEGMSALVATGRPIHWEIGSGLPPGSLHAGIPLSSVRPESAPRFGTLLDQAFSRLYSLSVQPGGQDRSARRVFAVAATGLGRYAYERGDLGRAARLFDVALQYRPHHAAAHLNRAIVFARQRDYTQAIRHAETILEGDPNHVQALINVARWQMRLNQDKNASKFIDRALALDANQASAWSLAALVDLRAGNVDRAKQRIQRAVSIDPGNKDVQDLLRQLRRKPK